MRVQTYPGLDHLAQTTADAPLTAAADWLMTEEPSAGRQTLRPRFAAWRLATGQRSACETSPLGLLSTRSAGLGCGSRTPHAPPPAGPRCGWSSIAAYAPDLIALHYLYVQRVSRARLLIGKWTALAVCCVLATACVLVGVLLVGLVVFGWHPFHLLGSRGPASRSSRPCAPLSGPDITTADRRDRAGEPDGSRPAAATALSPVWLPSSRTPTSTQERQDVVGETLLLGDVEPVWRAGVDA